MHEIKDYYQLVVKQVGKVSPAWKIAHIVIFITIAVLGFTATLLFGKALLGFNFNCVLYASINFKNITNSTKDVHDLTPLIERNMSMIDYRTTTWTSGSYCNFCQFMPLVSTISAVIWAIFFLTMSRGGAGYLSDPLTHPWRIVAPASIFCTLMLIPVSISYTMTIKGYQEFCSNFKDVIANPCTEEVDYYTIQFLGQKKPFVSYIETVIAFVRFLCILWAVQVAVLIARIIFLVDFQLIKVSLYEDVEKTRRINIGHEFEFAVPEMDSV